VELTCSKPRARSLPDVFAFNTNSRNDSAAQCRHKIEALAVDYSRLVANVIFKKVDSTLRGNVAEEIVTAMRTFKCGAALIAPAFPAMRRFVCDGILNWTDASGSGHVDLAGILAQQGISREKLIRMNSSSRYMASKFDAHVRDGKQFFIVDSESQDDLHFAVSVGTATSRRILWVGSAGLGIALAEHMAKAGAPRFVPDVTDAPTLFVVGSTHPASLRQKQMLLAATDAVEVAPEARTVAVARRAIRDRRHVVLSVKRGLSEFSLRQFFDGLNDLSVAALFLTGGDTATLACKAVGARSIDLRDEIVPGFPWGVLDGGMFHGLAVACKSGGFGDENSLLCCAEFFAPERRASI
jgi:D-threonate/D-erythronate kinase